MTRKAWLWLSAIAVLAVLVAYQVVDTSAEDRDRESCRVTDLTEGPHDGLPLGPSIDDQETQQAVQRCRTHRCQNLRSLVGPFRIVFPEASLQRCN